MIGKHTYMLLLIAFFLLLFLSATSKHKSFLQNSTLISVERTVLYHFMWCCWDGKFSGACLPPWNLKKRAFCPLLLLGADKQPGPGSQILSLSWVSDLRTQSTVGHHSSWGAAAVASCSGCNNELIVFPASWLLGFPCLLHRAKPARLDSPWFCDTVRPQYAGFWLN